MYIASVLTVIGAVWFYRTQHRPARALAAVAPAPAPDPDPGPEEEARDPEQAAPGP
jgi:hypothetical protein